MRFLRLDLKAVGPFTAANLDLSGGKPGLHLIVGPNEAGKSSALRAITYLLFGFPHEAPDARFVHDYPRLRVGGVLQGSLGDVLEIVRRKRAKDSLVGPDETSVVPEPRLQEMLGHIDRATFENLLGIDHARLRQGGKQIREGRGEFAGLLFAAGAGLSGLRKAQSQLQNRMSELYLDRGQKPRINATCQEIRQARDDLNQRILNTDEWKRHDQAHQEANDQHGQVTRQIETLQRELQRSQRLLDAIPINARRRRLRADLEQLAETPRLRPEFGDEVRSAFNDQQAAALSIQRSEEHLRQLADKIEALPDSSTWIASAASIEAIQKKLSTVEKAAQDRLKIVEPLLRDVEHTARGLLRDLGQTADLTTIGSLLLRADEPDAIRAVDKERATMATRADEARKAIRRYDQQLDRLESETIDEPPDVEALRLAAESARKAGDLDEPWVRLRRKSDTADRELARALSRIPGWSGDAEQLRALPEISDATIGRFDRAFQKLDQDEQQFQKDRVRIEAELREVEAQLRALELSLDVPTEHDLAASRETRDQVWQEIRQSWIDGTAADRAPRQAAADHLETTIGESDALADRLRREAEAVARKSHALANQERLRTARDELDRRAEDHQKAAQKLADDWGLIPSSLGLTDSTPAEVRDWLKLRDKARQALDQADEARQAQLEIDADRQSKIRSIREALRPHAPDNLGQVDSLGPLLDQAEAIVKRADTVAQQRRDRENQRQTARNEREAAQATLQAAQDAMAPLLDRWSAWMNRLHLEPSASIEQAEVFLKKLDQLRESHDKIRDTRSRLAGIARDEAAFANSVRELAGQLLPNAIDQTPEDLARSLAGHLTTARERNQSRITLEGERDQEADHLQNARDQRSLAEARLRRLADEAGGIDPADLLRTEGLSIHRANLERELAECDDQLRAYASGRDWDDFHHRLESADPDVLTLQNEQGTNQIRALQDQLERINQTIGSEQAELARMKGGDDGAIAAENVQDLLARAREDVERFATLKLADAILRRGIERYRSQNQGPVLGRASDLFRTLTDGSFHTLRIDDDNGQAILQGVRPDGQTVGVEGMSDGSHDQLYLALRLAVLESWLDRREPIPFVVDDILLTFDDRRSAAALRALAQFSTRTQVLMFTHHPHLIDLAREAVPAGVLSVLEMPKSASLANVPTAG